MPYIISENPMNEQKSHVVTKVAYVFYWSDKQLKDFGYYYDMSKWAGYNPLATNIQYEKQAVNYFFPYLHSIINPYGQKDNKIQRLRHTELINKKVENNIGLNIMLDNSELWLFDYKVGILINEYHVDNDADLKNFNNYFLFYDKPSYKQSHKDENCYHFSIDGIEYQSMREFFSKNLFIKMLEGMDYKSIYGNSMMIYYISPYPLIPNVKKIPGDTGIVSITEYKKEKILELFETTRLYISTYITGVRIDKEKIQKNNEYVFDVARYHYFYIWLLVLIQRSIMLALSIKLNLVINSSNIVKISKLKSLRYRALRFTNKFRFTQITNYDIGDAVFKAFSETFDNDALFDTLYKELEEIDNYLENENLTMLNIGIFYIITPLTLFMGAEQANINFLNVLIKSSSNATFWTALLIVSIYYLIITAAIWNRETIFKMRRDK